MRATELLENLQKRGVRLICNDDALRAIAPAGVIKSEDRAAITANKPELLRLLSTHASDNQSAPVSHYSLSDAFAPQLCECGYVMVIEQWLGWRHAFCPAGTVTHAFDEWKRIEGSTPLSKAIAARRNAAEVAA